MTGLERLSREVRTLSNKIAKLTEAMPADKLLNLPQISEMLSMPVKTARTLLQNGDIDAVKVGKTWKVKQSAINAYIHKL